MKKSELKAIIRECLEEEYRTNRRQRDQKTGLRLGKPWGYSDDLEKRETSYKYPHSNTGHHGQPITTKKAKQDDLKGRIKKNLGTRNKLNLPEGKTLVNRRHGSAYDRGSADKWYKRYDPHYYGGETGSSKKVKITQKSHPTEWEEYHTGHNSHDDRKDF